MFSNIGDVFYATCHFWVSHMGQVLRQARKTREVLDPCLLKAGFLVVRILSHFVNVRSHRMRCAAVHCGVVRRSTSPKGTASVVNEPLHQKTEHLSIKKKNQKLLVDISEKNSCKKSKMDVGVWCYFIDFNTFYSYKTIWLFL